ncbi:uncharacterized protein N7503_006686 [Penicillium pulvis]|uniref:uncharacterized protein n=1 Tax=Penicillium pulvis TaxID=1562058 RepID=UPI0025497F74|nr:uncharacterized protein N7503_006686 [Penicillium pulvis]KAJ5797390.1 hypothetical protein N7503_006686 [Penicillium pulvis]
MAQAPVAWLGVTSAERPDDEFLKQTPTLSLNMPSATPAMRKIPAQKSPSFNNGERMLHPPISPKAISASLFERVSRTRALLASASVTEKCSIHPEDIESIENERE